MQPTQLVGLQVSDHLAQLQPPDQPERLVAVLLQVHV